MKEDHIEQRRRFISDAFHTLNQPLTGLHCGLEIALQKPRSEGEYRQRISDGIENAGAILTLVRAVRQLVDAADPGERLGTVSLSLLLTQMKSELEVVSETTHVDVKVECKDDVWVMADPGKLLASLGGLAASEMEAYEPGAMVKIAVKPGKKCVGISLIGKGTRKMMAAGGGQSTAEKAADIRRNAAFSYLWTVGGDCEVMAEGLKIKLPVAANQSD